MRILSSLSILLILIGSFSFEVMAEKSSAYEQVFTLMKQKKWPEAERVARSTGDRALQKIVLSERFKDSNYSKNSFEGIVKFLQENPNWPAAKFLKLKAESYINDSTDKRKIIDFFAKDSPGTAKGHKYYALAAAEKMPNPAPMIKKGWIMGNFTKAEETLYYKRFKKYLSEDDHVKKIDNHLWSERNSNAKNLLHFVGFGYRKSLEAQIAFMENKQKALKIFSSVPEKYYTPGLIYEYLNSVKSNPPDSGKVVSMFRTIKEDGGRSEDFWRLQTYIIREYIEQHKFQDAYTLSASHCATSPAHVSEAEFLAGWLALRFLKDPNLAISHFTKMRAVVKTPVSISRSLYWLGRANASAGAKEKAHELYKEAALKYGYSFYGQLSGLETGSGIISLPKSQFKDYQDDGYAKNSEIVRAMNIAIKYGSAGFARTYIDAAVNQTANPQQIYSMIRNLGSSKNALHYRTWLAKGAIQKHAFVAQYAYPVPYKLPELPLHKTVVYSIIRQESVFDQYAVSSASAMGLMQLIKGTACEVSKSLNTKCNIDRLTKDPQYNILLGSNYLNSLIKKFDGSYILAIAAYNGAKIGRWIDLHGDPRTFKDLYKVIDWLEMIPFAETRNYVQRVIENIQNYHYIIEKSNKNVIRHYLMPTQDKT